MISTTQPLVNFMASKGFACSSQTKTVTPKQVDEPLDFCLCADRCDYLELAFSSDDGDEFKNDTSSFLVDMVDLAGTFEFFLDDGTTRTPLTDDTYGLYFGLGDLPQANKVGFIVDWKKVGEGLGYKEYTFVAEVTEFSVDYEQESHTYKATQFSERQADGTIRIKTINSGCTQNGVDYTGMFWPRSVRLLASLIEQTPELEQIEGLNSQRQPVQVQVSMRALWQVETGFIPGSVYSLIKNDLMSQDLKVDNYDLYQFRQTRAKPMVLSEIEELDTDYSQNAFGRLIFALKDLNLELKRNT